MTPSPRATEPKAPMIHPVQRAVERGITHPDPLAIVRAIERAVNLQMSEFVERVLRLPDGNVIWRFNVEADGIFYAICTPAPNAQVLTIITQEMLRGYRRRRKVFRRTKREAK